MKLKNITFVFENCDYITIDGKYVGDFIVDDIKTSISRIACNAIERMDIAYTFAIEIHKDANKERYQFGQEQCEDFKQMTFDRFCVYDDITSIQFELENEYDLERNNCIQKYDYYIDWTGDSDNENEAQDTYVSNYGNLYIVINANKNIEDFFDMEEINDEEHMEFYCNMMDIGDKYSNPDRYKSEEK